MTPPRPALHPRAPHSPGPRPHPRRPRGSADVPHLLQRLLVRLPHRRRCRSRALFGVAGKRRLEEGARRGEGAQGKQRRWRSHWVSAHAHARAHGDGGARTRAWTDNCMGMGVGVGMGMPVRCALQLFQLFNGRCAWTRSHGPALFNDLAFTPLPAPFLANAHHAHPSSRSFEFGQGCRCRMRARCARATAAWTCACGRAAAWRSFSQRAHPCRATPR